MLFRSSILNLVANIFVGSMTESSSTFEVPGGWNWVDEGGGWNWVDEGGVKSIVGWVKSHPVVRNS